MYNRTTNKIMEQMASHIQVHEDNISSQMMRMEERSERRHEEIKNLCKQNGSRDEFLKSAREEKLEQLVKTVNVNFAKVNEVLNRVMMLADEDRSAIEKLISPIIVSMENLEKEFCRHMHGSQLIAYRSFREPRDVSSDQSCEADVRQMTAEPQDQQEHGGIRGLEQSVAAMVRHSLEEFQHEVGLAKHEMLLDQQREMLTRVERSIDDRIHKSCDAIKSFLVAAQIGQESRGDKIMKYLAELTSNSMNRVLTSTDQLKESLRFIYAKQAQFASETHQKISLLQATNEALVENQKN